SECKVASLGNVRLLQIESFYAVRYLLPAESVESFFLLFLDPWRNRRHDRRRIFSRDFLDSVAVALEENGLLHMATDQLDYFQQIQRLSRAHPQFEIVDLDDVVVPLTKFERRFREHGAPIHGLTLRNISKPDRTVATA